MRTWDPFSPLNLNQVRKEKRCIATSKRSLGPRSRSPLVRFQFLGGRRAGRLPSVLREHLSGSRMLLSSLRGFTKWIQRSADPRSNDMKIQRGKEERGQKGCQISPKEHDGDIVSSV